MSVRTPQWLRPPHLSLAIAATTALAMAAIVEAGPFRNPWRQRTTVERLAEKIDQVEKVLDTYGTVVAKSPDVWGEARLTKYRRDVEDVLSDQLTKFQPTLSSTITRSDQAFLASSLALQAALGGRRAAIVSPTDRVESEVTETVATTSDGTIQLAPDGRPIIVKKSTPRVIADGTTTDQQIPGSPSEPSGMTATFAKRAELLTATGAGGFANGNTVGIEPTVMLDQLTRYLDHLNQLRRTNDGDDLSDSPGYALHLVRIPVSVLPGKCTKEGYGAEVTITAKAHLHDKLLSETFRSLVINDLVDQLSFPLAKLIDEPQAETLIDAMKRGLPSEDAEEARRKLCVLEAEQRRLEAEQKQLKAELAEIAKKLDDCRALAEKSDKAEQNVRSFAAAVDIAKKNLPIVQQQQVQALSANRLALKTDELQESIEKIEIPEGEEFKPLADWINGIREVEALKEKRQTVESALKEQTNAYRERIQRVYGLSNEELSTLNFECTDPESARRSSKQLQSLYESKMSSLNANASRNREIASQISQLQAIMQQVVQAPSVSVAPSRRALLPYEPGQMVDVYGYPQFGQIADATFRLKSDILNKRAALLLDVQRVLIDKLSSAHALLQSRTYQHLWSHCTPDLAEAVRSHQSASIQSMRESFLSKLAEHSAGCTATAALAWGIIVESALLNERLIEDMRLMQTAKNCHCISTDWMEFFRPEPAPEAVMAFNQYVECRWPVHVFAIDPETDDQNVLDSFSQRREMQLALSLAFASGKIGAQQFMRFARTMDLDMQTIALNRTAVGFSHGDDTFGWRFYPRVQSPPSRGNLAVVTREMLIGGYTQDQQLSTRRLEPGMRECTAIVLMPAFVPYAIFDLRTNWFKLTNPAKKELDLRDGVGISADIVALRQLSQACVQDAALYRDSDVYQLTRAVDQLERRLPMQTTYVQLPFENSLGGFEFFNGGAPDLAPELHGFYGEPGISAKDGVESTMFLVGDNFSVHETNVIVGNQAIDEKKMKMISRQVLQVTVKAPVGVVEDKVDIHVATPYGVTNHLLVPLIDAAAESADKALADHEEERHVDRFAWKSPPSPTLIVDVRNGDITNPRLAQADKRKVVKLISDSQVKDLQFADNEQLTAKMAAQLVIKSSDSTKAPEIHPVGAWSVEIGKDLALKSLVDKFPMALSKVPNGFDPKEIEFVGFLRFPAANNMPTLRLENKLVFRVVKSDETNDASSAPPPAAGILPPGELLPPAPDPAEARRLQRLPLPLSP